MPVPEFPTLEELHARLLSSFSVSYGGVIDNSQGSIAYTLTRAMAATLNEVNIRVSEITAGYFVATAVGAHLDDLAINYGLTRRLGLLASGHVLSLAQEDTLIVENTVLTDIETGLQYHTRESKNAPIFREQLIPIQALEVGDSGNLGAGAQMVSELYPNVVFVVGTHRTPSGQICGHLKGGEDYEDDELFRRRISQTIRSVRETTPNAIRARLLQDSIVNWVSLEIPINGGLLVWVEASRTLTSRDKQRLLALLETYKAAGIQAEILQARRKNVEIEYRLPPLPPSFDLDALSQDIIAETRLYLEQIPVGAGLDPKELEDHIATSIDYPITVLRPEDVLPSSRGEVIRAIDILITYDF